MRIAYLLLPAAMAIAAEPAADPGPWTWHSKLGAFLQNVSSQHAETSRDPAIAGASDSSSWKVHGEGTLLWKSEPGRFEQRLEADYGRIKSGTEDRWLENTDSISYAATYEGILTGPQFLYGNGTADSVFTGPEPDKEPLDPLVCKLSSGYGQRYDDLLPPDDSLSWRLGVYARKRWESNAPRYQTDVNIGPEAYVRYERRQSEDVSYFAQAEAYGDFIDRSHAICQGEAGLNVRVARRLTVEVKLRSYFESRPEEAGAGVPGYDEWSLREEALIGIVWETGSS
jgi:hypothetical protein